MVEGKVEDGMGFRGSAIFSVWVQLVAVQREP